MFQICRLAAMEAALSRESRGASGGARARPRLGSPVSLPSLPTATASSGGARASAGTWAPPDLAGAPPAVAQALQGLRPAHVAELSAAIGQPGGDMFMQYMGDSGSVATLASVLNCAVMLARDEARPEADLWDFDWEATGKALEPPDQFTTAILSVATRLIGGGRLNPTMAKSLWREMNRMPHIWQAQALAPPVLGPRGACTALPGLEKLRLCVRAIAALAAPSPAS